MSASPAEILAKYLVDLETAYWPGQGPPDAFHVTVKGMPADGDREIALTDSGGIQLPAEMQRGQNKVFWNIRCLIRVSSYPDGVDKCKEIESICRAIGIPLDRSGAGQYVAVAVRGGNFAVKSIRIKTPFMFLAEEPDTQRSLFTLNLSMSYFRTS